MIPAHPSPLADLPRVSLRERSGQLGVDPQGSAIFIHGSKRRTTAAILTARPFVRAKGIGGAVILHGKNTALEIRSPLKSHASHKLPGKSRDDRAYRLECIQFRPFVGLIVHGFNHDRRKLTCPTSVVKDCAK